MDTNEPCLSIGGCAHYSCPGEGQGSLMRMRCSSSLQKTNTRYVKVAPSLVQLRKTDSARAWPRVARRMNWLSRAPFVRLQNCAITIQIWTLAKSAAPEHRSDADPETHSRLSRTLIAIVQGRDAWQRSRPTLLHTPGVAQ